VVAATIEAGAVELVGLRLRIPMAPAKRTPKSLFLQLNRTLGKLLNLRRLRKLKKHLTWKRQNLMRLITARTLLLQTQHLPLPPLSPLPRVSFRMVSRRVGQACLLLLQNQRRHPNLWRSMFAGIHLCFFASETNFSVDLLNLPSKRNLLKSLPLQSQNHRLPSLSPRKLLSPPLLKLPQSPKSSRRTSPHRRTS
jgi:hypothetical protein